MSRLLRVAFEFVEFIPSEMSVGILYVSVAYATASHLCCCGCGSKVVTPLTPTDWTLIFDGESVSLDPSIGSWGLPCRSHYWIARNRVQWAAPWSQERVDSVRDRDRVAKQRYFEAVYSAGEDAGESPGGAGSTFWADPTRKWWR